MPQTRNHIGEKIICHHCGDECPSVHPQWKEHRFCCRGCEMVFQLLSKHNMEAYYKLEFQPGSSQKNILPKAYEYLDDPDVITTLLTFQEGNVCRILFHLPQIHCSSCLWLLENLDKMESGITGSRVNFLKKEATIQFNSNQVSLRQVVVLLSKIGYEPSLHLHQLSRNPTKKKVDNSILYKLGLAGFSFGNIMLLSFPEYLGFEQASVIMYFGYINLILATPVLLYCSRDYLISAWKSIRINRLNLDVPIAIGMLTLFSRSTFEILSHTGEGYLDSFTGFVFFILIGKWFQSFTYKALDFDRNYKSYFPVSATIRDNNTWTTRALDKIKPKDHLLIKNQELIPTDAFLIKGKARIDYSFVTGESDLIHKELGEKVLAGGKQMGNNIEVKVIHDVDQSYLTQLWNDNNFKENSDSFTSNFIDVISKYFTYIVLLIAGLTLLYWLYIDKAIAFNAFTAVLIVACPCALALAIPFTYGNVLRLLSRRGVYLRNTKTIEDLQDIKYIVFDKTGTLTDNSKIELQYEGHDLADDLKTLIKSACCHSSHPLSTAIVTYFSDAPIIEIDFYEDYIGQGLLATIDEKIIKIGSSSFIFGTEQRMKERGVFIEIDGKYIGYFRFQHAFREGMTELIAKLNDNYKLSMLSGDSNIDAARITSLFDSKKHILFDQSPLEKLEYIKKLQSQGKKVMMIGDGLNDAGALKQSDIGLVISENTNNFSPACDGILSATAFVQFFDFIRYIKSSRYIIYGAFVLALTYNLIGLYFAVTGSLSPVIAAILMPLSSITIVLYGTTMSLLLGQSMFSKTRNNKRALKKTV